MLREGSDHVRVVGNSFELGDVDMKFNSCFSIPWSWECQVSTLGFGFFVSKIGN
jgi:hypothetical protein